MMSTSEHASVSEPRESEYICNIKKTIIRKKNILLRKASREGQNAGQALCEPFIRNVHMASKKILGQKLNLIMEQAEKIVQTKLGLDERAIVPMALKLLRNVAEHTDVELIANPTDAIALKASLSEITIACASLRKVVLTEDSMLARGSMIIKADKSIIDAHLRTQTEKAKDILLSHVELKYGASY